MRDEVAAALLELALTEVLCWGLVQTDPNFANFRYQAERRRLQLFDFGATRTYPSERRATLRDLMRAALDGDDADLLRTVTEPARAPAGYAFGHSDLARRMSDMVIGLRLREGFGRLPPPEVLFLHRKLGGLYLLLSRLRATLPVGRLLSGLLEPCPTQPRSHEQTRSSRPTVAPRSETRERHRPAGSTSATKPGGPARGPRPGTTRP